MMYCGVYIGDDNLSEANLGAEAQLGHRLDGIGVVGALDGLAEGCHRWFEIYLNLWGDTHTSLDGCLETGGVGGTMARTIHLAEQVDGVQQLVECEPVPVHTGVEELGDQGVCAGG